MSPAITRSGGPDAYAFCTKYAPSAVAASRPIRQSKVSQLELALFDLAEHDLRERRDEAVEHAGHDDVEDRPDARAEERERDAGDGEHDRRG